MFIPIICHFVNFLCDLQCRLDWLKTHRYLPASLVLVLMNMPSWLFKIHFGSKERLNLVLCCYIKPLRPKSTLVRKGFISAYKLQFKIKWSQGKNSRQETEAETMEECSLPTCSQDHLPRSGAAQSGMGLPLSVCHQGSVPTDMCTGFLMEAAPLSWDSFFLGVSSWQVELATLSLCSC